MSTSQRFAVEIQLEDNGTVSAYVPDLPGVYAAADTQAGALRGIREALEGYLETMRARGWPLPTHLPNPADP
jgi:predicted RNase H-like HicB family nuclease